MKMLMVVDRNVPSTINKHFLLSVLVATLFSSCCDIHNEIDYEYRGIRIRRVDECGKTSFYYHDGENQIDGEIFVEYSGISDGFSGYLKFDKSGRVLLLSGDGDFQIESIDTTKFNYKRIYAFNRPILDGSVYQIMLSTKYEAERNKESQSRVKATY